MGIAHVSAAMFRSRSARRNRGYSLAELLVVMAIMAALSLVAIPWFLKISQRNALKSAAREVQTTLLAARMKAVRRNQPVSVAITPGPPVQLVVLEPQPPAPTPGAYEYVLRGPLGVATPNQITVQVWPNGRVVVVTPTDWY